MTGYTETDPIWNAAKVNYALLASPALTGTPTAPTATAGTSTTQLATTQFVTTADAIINTNVATATGDIATLKTNLATATGNIATATGQIATLNTNVATITGQIVTINSNVATATGNIAYLSGAKANLNSPALTGTPTAPTPATADNSTTLATTAYVKANIAGFTSSGTVWSLSGNAITSADFLGTTNAQPLIFKTNNTEYLRISSTGAVGVPVRAGEARGAFSKSSSLRADCALVAERVPLATLVI